MERITTLKLEYVAGRINKATNSPMNAYTRFGNKYTLNVGHHHVHGACAGYQLQRICNASGGVTCPLGEGYTTKRELYEKMRAYLAGLEHHETLLNKPKQETTKCNSNETE